RCGCSRPGACWAASRKERAAPTGGSASCVWGGHDRRAVGGARGAGLYRRRARVDAGRGTLPGAGARARAVRPSLALRGGRAAGPRRPAGVRPGDAGRHPAAGAGRMSPRRAELIAVGSELLEPWRTDTNGSYLSRRLGEAGIAVRYRTIVGDDLDDL